MRCFGSCIVHVKVLNLRLATDTSHSVNPFRSANVNNQGLLLFFKQPEEQT